MVYSLAGSSPAKLRVIRPYQVRVAALVDRTLRELLEMQYQFAEPFIVDSTKIASRLGVPATHWARR